ncbi:MAG: cysteine hydrolase family protein [Pseudorhodobacter sp.]
MTSENNRAAGSALIIIDLQNDFLHPKGAYGRAGQTASDVAAVPGRLAPFARALQSAGGLVVSTQFTLVPAKGGEPIISADLKKHRSFLTRGDFEPGAWGSQLVDELQPADLIIEKVAYSAFYMTRLEWCLRKCGIEKLWIAGIVTNGGVASTVRDAHVRDFHTTVLEDGCAAFSPQAHETTIASLRNLVPVMTVSDAARALTGK